MLLNIDLGNLVRNFQLGLASFGLQRSAGAIRESAFGVGNLFGLSERGVSRFTNIATGAQLLGTIGIGASVAGSFLEIIQSITRANEEQRRLNRELEKTAEIYSSISGEINKINTDTTNLSSELRDRLVGSLEAQINLARQELENVEQRLVGARAAGAGILSADQVEIPVELTTRSITLQNS